MSTSCPETWVDDHRSLRIAKDLCIRVKHVELSNDRTGKPRFASLTDVSPESPFHHQVEIQWPDKEAFFQRWREIEKCDPDAFLGKSPPEAFEQGYHRSGYEQECWNFAYAKGHQENALEVARRAREDWKQYFLKWDDWTQIFPAIVEGSTDEQYEWWFGPGGSGLRV